MRPLQPFSEPKFREVMAASCRFHLHNLPEPGFFFVQAGARFAGPDHELADRSVGPAHAATLVTRHHGQGAAVPPQRHHGRRLRRRLCGEVKPEVVLLSLCSLLCTTVLVLRMAHRIWKETKQEPGTARTGNMPGCCLNTFHFLWAILSTSTVQRIH